MPFPHPHAFLMLKVPPAQHAITAAAEQQFSRRTPGQRIHFLAWLVQGVQLLPALHIPDEKLSTASAPTAAGQQPPIGTPRNSHDHTTMPFHRCSHRPVGGIPQEDAAIIAATCQPCPIGTPRNTTDPARLFAPDPQARPGEPLPHPHPLLLAATGHNPSLA